MSHAESTPERAARSIARLIKKNDLQAGDPLPAQRDLARELGVSRASLREALATMETLGIVRVSAGKGVFVADPAGWQGPRGDRGQKVAQVYQFRLAMEPFIAGLAAQLRSKQQAAELTANVEKMRLALAEGDLVAAARADIDFHQILMQASGNPLFAAALPANALHENQMLPFANAPSLAAPLPEHEQILLQVLDRNPAGARDAMHRHILSAATRAGAAFLRP